MADPVLELSAELLPLGSSPYVIQAYKIHLSAQTIYSLTGDAVTVTLIANEIVFDDGVVIDVTGDKGGDKGKHAPAGQPGQTGDPGDPLGNNPGKTGGTLNIWANTITGSGPSCSITLKADGGNGGKGEDGGDGAIGQTGGDCQNGGKGGDGGPGGPGGNAGSGGTVAIVCANPIGITINTSCVAGHYGNGGNPGGGGGGGAAGPRTGFYGHVVGMGEFRPPPPWEWNCDQPSNGPAGSQGAAGNHGSPGSNGFSNIVVDGKKLLTTILPALDVNYWKMVLEGAESDYANGNWADAIAKLNWICSIGSNGNPVVDDYVSRAATLVVQLKSGLDFYGHPKNFAQTLSVGTWETSNSAIVDSGIALENALTNYQQQRDDQVKRMTALDTAIKQANSQITQSQKDRDTLLKQQGPLNAQIGELLAEQLTAMTTVSQAATALNAALAGGGCTMAEIISAVTLICTVASGLPVAATSIASAASAANAAGNQLGQPPTLANLKGLIQDVQVISSNVGIASSKLNEITTAYNNLKNSMGGNAPDPKVDTTKFLVGHDDFAETRKDVESQIDQLPESGAKKAYKDAVERYLNIVQTRNQQLLSYSGITFKVAAIDANKDFLETTIADLNTQRQNIQAADVTPLLDQLKKMHQKMLQGVFFDILQQSRALDYWSLDPQDPPQQYADFNALKAILGTLSQRKVDALQAAANPPATFPGLSMSLPVSDEDRASLSSNGLMYFYLSPEMPVFADLARILISSITVDFLLPDGSAIHPIRYNLEHSGYHKFLNTDGKVFEFLTTSRAVVQGVDGNGMPNIQGNFAGSDLSLDSSNAGAATYVGVSPFTRWKINAAMIAGIDQHLNNVQQLRITMSGFARPLNP